MMILASKRKENRPAAPPASCSSWCGSGPCFVSVVSVMRTDPFARPKKRKSQHKSKSTSPRNAERGRAQNLNLPPNPQKQRWTAKIIAGTEERKRNRPRRQRNTNRQPASIPEQQKMTSHEQTTTPTQGQQASHRPHTHTPRHQTQKARKAKQVQNSRL